MNRNMKHTINNNDYKLAMFAVTSNGLSEATKFEFFLIHDMLSLGMPYHDIGAHIVSQGCSGEIWDAVCREVDENN